MSQDNLDYKIPAFPVAIAPACFNEGMTLLDYFAAKALPYCMAQIDAKNNPVNAAHHAYRYAAAMLEERKHYINR